MYKTQGCFASFYFSIPPAAIQTDIFLKTFLVQATVLNFAMRSSNILYSIIVFVFLFQSASIIILSASLIFHSGGIIESIALALDLVALAIVIGFLIHEIINPRESIIRSRNLIVFMFLFGLSLASLVIFLVRTTSTETKNLTKDFAALPDPRATATTAIILAVLSTIFAIAGFATSCVVQEIPQARLKISDPIPVRVWQPDTPAQFIELGSVQKGDPPQPDEAAIRERWTDIPV